MPLYEFSDPELRNDWKWSQRYPDSAEFRAYFNHVADVWDLRRDCTFGVAVESASWDDAKSKWRVTLSNGSVVVAQFFLPNTGVSHRRYVPDWPGVEKFRGTFLHPSYWPNEDIDLKGKRLAIIGTGSTGVQLFQALSPDAKSVHLFQRTPGIALPMKQTNYPDGGTTGPTEQEYADMLKMRYLTIVGGDYHNIPRTTFEDTPEQRAAVYEDLWAYGDFRFWVGSYQDVIFDDKANTEAYNFW